MEAVLCHEDHVPDCVRGDVLFHRRREAADHGALPGTAPVNQGRDAKVNINSERCVNPGCAAPQCGGAWVHMCHDTPGKINFKTNITPNFLHVTQVPVSLLLSLSKC